MSPVTTRIVGKFQITVPPEIREIYDLQIGDLLEWTYDEATGQIHLAAKRAQLITPRVLELENELDAARKSAAGATRQIATSR